jgi:hypothetical protein
VVVIREINHAGFTLPFAALISKLLCVMFLNEKRISYAEFLKNNFLLKLVELILISILYHILKEVKDTKFYIHRAPH